MNIFYEMADNTVSRILLLQDQILEEFIYEGNGNCPQN